MCDAVRRETEAFLKEICKQYKSDYDYDYDMKEEDLETIFADELKQKRKFSKFSKKQRERAREVQQKEERYKISA